MVELFFVKIMIIDHVLILRAKSPGLGILFTLPIGGDVFFRITLQLGVFERPVVSVSGAEVRIEVVEYTPVTDEERPTAQLLVLRRRDTRLTGNENRIYKYSEFRINT